MVKALQLKCRGSSMVVQWLRLCTLNTGGLVLISGQETRFHMPQLRVYMPQLKIPCAGRQNIDLNCAVHLYTDVFQ